MNEIAPTDFVIGFEKQRPKPVAIESPVGVVPPAYLGAMWWDPVSHVFYQARSMVPGGWRLVAPADMAGSFIKVFRYFIGVPGDDPVGEHARRDFLADHDAVRATMVIDGVNIEGTALRWRTAGGADVMQVRLTFRRPGGLSLFVGFAESPARPHAMPSGVGFAVEDGVIRFGEHEEPVGARKTRLFRIVLDSGEAAGFLDDGLVLRGPVRFATAPEPVVALFNRREAGERPTAPGYDKALKRSLER